MASVRFQLGPFSFGPNSFRTPRYAKTYNPLLGGDVTITVDGRTQRHAQRAQGILAREMFRLEEILELDRFPYAHEASEPEDPRHHLLTHTFHATRASEMWRQKSAGVFNSQVALMMERWALAETEGNPPTDAELAGIAEGIARPAEPGDTISLGGLGKGYVVERAVRAVERDPSINDDVRRILIRVGADLRHIGSDTMRVGIDDPRDPAGSAPALAVVSVCGDAISQSGSASPGRPIIDARTGQPAASVISANVIADDLITADALATILAVLDPAEGLAFVGDRAACLIVDRTGDVHRNAAWVDREAAPTAQN